jgi:rhodanese-related sulfurtransferase
MMKTLFYIAMFLVLTGMVACKQKTDQQASATLKEVKTVGVDEFEKLIADTQHYMLVDVRTKEEFDEGHLKGAIQRDVKSRTFRVDFQRDYPTKKTIAVYCRSGFRSKTAANILAGVGYDVVNLRGGYQAWTEAGKETEQ